MFYDHPRFGRKVFRADKRRYGKKPSTTDNRWKAADGAFRCANCGLMVFPTGDMGTVHRNHCPFCLHSLHVDTSPGNRASTCHARMKPVALTCKRRKLDKYGRERHGDIMLVHFCAGCGAISVNRIAGDDSCPEILAVFARSLALGQDVEETIAKAGVRVLSSDNAELLHVALYGKAQRD